MLILTIIQGPDKGRSFELPDHEPQLLGRSSEALPLTDTTVSRRHAELTPDKGAWTIRDLGSQNGTWVNGVRIARRTVLRAGDQVRVGATLLVYGRAAREPGLESVSIVRDQISASVERAMISNEDSVLLSDSVTLGDSQPRHSAVDHLRVIYQLSTLTSAMPERDIFLQGVMSLVFAEFKPERGVVMLIDEASAGAGAGTLTPVVVRFAHDDSGASGSSVHFGSVAGASASGTGAAAGPSRQERLQVPRSILQHCLSRNEGVLSTNAAADPRFAPGKGAGAGGGGGSAGGAGAARPAAGDSVARMNIRSAICSPIRFRDRTFGVIYIDSSAGPPFNADQLALMNAVGQQTGLALANAELVAQKVQSERLAAMGETVASLSHSIKNILQGLRGGADVVEMGLKREDLKVASGGWSILKRNLDRIISLTMNMLAYSRPRALEPELTRIGGLLDDCASLLRDMCDARGVVLIVDPDPEMPPIVVDAGQMHQAMMNLMTNAVEAVESRAGVVTVKAAIVGGGAGGGGDCRVQIIDNGPGVPVNLQRRIFEPFVTTKGLRGTGLGLAVSKRIAELHGGRLEVRSPIGNGRGSCFELTIPVGQGGGVDPAQTADAQGKDRRPAV